MKEGPYIKKTAGVFAVLVLTGSFPAYADPSVEVTQALQFGTVIGVRNDAVYTITLPPDGGSLDVTGNGLVPSGGAAQAGEFQLDGFTENDQVSIVFDPAEVELLCSCVGPSLYVDNFTMLPGSVTIDGTGSQTVSFGARIKTSASGIRYQGDSYSGTVNVSFIIDN